MHPITEPILEVTDLRKEFRIRNRGVSRPLTAVDGVSLSLRAGETVALVGESGSGKSTFARCVARLIEPTAGQVRVGRNYVTDIRPRDLSRVYADLQMVFQDPTASLNPRMSVRQILDEPLRLHTDLGRENRQSALNELVESVSLSQDFLDRMPSQLSGGQRQRVGIARALAVNPRVVLLDEPTASLDVSVRGQILKLLSEVQQKKDLAYLFISHDLDVVRTIADRVLVMYLGRIVEEGATAEVFDSPIHPYTRALLSAAPRVEYGRAKSRFRLRGEIPSPMDLPLGCRLVSRCPDAVDACRGSDPGLVGVTPTHSSACPVGNRGVTNQGPE